MKWLNEFFTWFFHGTAEQRAARSRREQKRRAARAYARMKRDERMMHTLKMAREAMAGTFVIADLETTGLSARDEILEFAAIRADASGRVLEELSMLIKVRRPVPAEITALTGISQNMVNRHGIAIEQAFPQFLTFCGEHPVFFHNSGFDKRFIDATADRLGRRFTNPVHCSLKVARAVWPELPSHKLIVLARHVGAPAPTHRGLDDVRATLQVLLTARNTRAVLEAA